MKMQLKKITAAALAAILCGICSCEAQDPVIEEQSVPTEAQTGGEAPLPEEPEFIRAAGTVVMPDTYGLFGMDDIYSKGVYMAELGSGTVVAAKSPDERLIPASLTKIMTAVVCLQEVRDIDLEVVCAASCFEEFSSGDPNVNGASGCGLEPWQTGVTFRDCLYGLMLPSGCEAANVIAYNVTGGDIPAFIQMMNDTAKRIGCTGTNFTNAHGLYDKNNYSTARDMYLITKFALEKYPEFAEISCSGEYEMPANKAYPSGYTIYHTNRMTLPDSEYYYEGARGIKTGSLDEYFELDEETGEWIKADERGVRGLVSLCERDGFRYLLTTLCSPFYNEDGTRADDPFTYLDHKALFDKAFEEFEYRQVIRRGDTVLTVPVIGGEYDNVDITADADFSALLPRSADIGSVLKVTLPDNIDPFPAPLSAGDEVGELVIETGGDTVLIPLVISENIAAEALPAA